MENESPVECAIAIVWPEKSEEPVCEMFRVDHRTMTWTSKHYSSGATFADGGRLHDGETARTLAAILGVYLVLHAAFAGLFTWTGGVANAAPGSFKDAFFFSVQTMATIGYGAMFPQSDAAQVLVVIESMVGLVFTAIATGLV